MPRRPTLRLVSLTACVFLIAGVPLIAGLVPQAAAQRIVPALFVDDRVITQFEIEQRALFLELFNTPGDLEEEAIERLIDERLQLAEARRRGIRLTDEQIDVGMEEFAGRVNLSSEEFIEAIGQAGLSPAAFRDFVEAGLAWREVLRQRFAGRVDITDPEVDRAMSLTAQRGGVRVLLSEIILPDVPEARELAAELARITSFEAFEAAAREFSAAESADRGGRIDWVPLANVPEAVRPMLLQMRPGQVTPPIPSQEAIILLQLRALDVAESLPPASIAVDYAVALVPGAGTPAAEAEVARILGRADSCADFAAAMRNAPEEAYRRVESALSEVPADIALQLARLDEREVSTNLRQGDNVVLVMLCSRTPGGEQRPSRSEMRERLLDDRLGELADGFLAELRAAATIRRP